jgi:hypothetical protein
VTAVSLGVFFLGLTVIVVAAVFVTGPLFTASGALPAPVATDRERWERQKRQALAAIREAEVDHHMGKLSDDDLGTLRARLEAQALEAMAALERGGWA